MAGHMPKLCRLACNIRNISLIKRPYTKLGVYRGFRTSALLDADAIKIKMPALSPTMTEGNIIKWYKKEGDAIHAGDVLCDVETDKAVVSFDVEEEGTLAKIVKPENSKQIALGTVIAYMVEEGEDWKSAEIPAEEPAPEPSQPPAAAPPPSPPQPTAPASTPPPPSSQATAATAGSHVSGIGPAVRSIIDLYHINPSSVTATGPHGILLKGDMLKYIAQNNLKPGAPKPAAAPSPTQAAPVAAAPAPPPPSPGMGPLGEEPDFIDIPLTNMRKTIAKRLTESKSNIPHAYTGIDCNVDALNQLRKELKGQGIKVSVNDFIIKGVALALKKIPEINCVWNGESRTLQDNIDISVAVATDSGLITPIVKDVINLGVQEISANVKELAQKARSNKLQPHEFMGGSFTISNLGMFGITEFTAVINPPQACIMAVGCTRSVLDDEGNPQSLMNVTISSDARVVNDFEAASFLEAFKEYLEKPSTMLTGQGSISKGSLFAS